MLESALANTSLSDSTAAGEAIGQQISAGLQGHAPDALIVFASPRYDYAGLLAAIQAGCRPALLVGCSSAGEFTSDVQAEGSVSAVALRSSDIQFTAGVGHGLRADRAAAARDLVGSFRGMDDFRYLYRTALIFTDALAGQADDLVAQLTLLTAGTYQLCGGGAGDDAHFQKTHVFCGTEAITDAAVGLEILSNTPVGIGVGHGWTPATPAMRVTDAAGMRIASMNATPPAEIFAEHAAHTAQSFDPAAPLPFFLHNVVGIAGSDGYHLRVPLSIDDAGAALCAADVPVNSTVHIMCATNESAAEAAGAATRAALQQLAGHTPKVALFFDCVATRLRLGQQFTAELQTVQRELGSVTFAGCNTYGQIARAGGQFSGFHNCTAVVCIIAE
ncbi:MAG TPA: FIST N-terminal domain-containing protein [Chloroflexia bacterium]|nr:FIST N-terminal domain-containing protein [Chloroflexia bacterium]